MTLVRILVDGHNLLQHWKDLAPGKPPESDLAREELINCLTRYSDAAAVPVTVVFDGKNASNDLVLLPPAESVEVLFTRPGQPVAQLLERLARRLNSQGACSTIAADQFLEKEPAEIPGATVLSCDDFIKTVRDTLADLEQQIASLNQKENQKFSQHG